ncbi:MAG: phosphatidylglycerophosphatase A [Phycisphaerae bacterium]|nr:phosphatidylglycerophosphatase A [Phycisphaerae bacterium]
MSGSAANESNEGGAPTARASREPSGRLTALGRLSVTALGLGSLRPAPGTWGSLPPLIAVLVLLALGAPEWLVALIMFVGAAKSSILCLWFGQAAEAEFGHKDPSRVVVDEVAGQCVALLWLPWSKLGGERVLGDLTTSQLAVAVACFLLFRGFDIWKPPPARALQRLRGGAGILVDDLVAGAYALGASWLAALAIMRTD